MSVRSRRLVLALGLCAALGFASPALAAGNFARHLTLTVGAGVVGGPHANFPLLVQVISGDLITTPGGSVQSANGYDIVFRGEDAATCGGPATCMLDHEIEEYNGGAGILIAWVRVPSLAAGRVIHLYYGNPQISAPTSAAGAVFDANYVGVWHLNQVDNGGWNNTRDSSRYANHATGGDSEAPAMTTRTNGKIGFGQNFNNADQSYDFIDAGEDGSLRITGNQITLEAWLRHNIVPNTAHGCANPPHVPNCPAVPSTSNPYGIINHKGYDDGYRLFLMGDPFQCPNPAGGLTAPCLGFSVPGRTDTLYSSQYGSPATDPVTSGVWHHAAATYDGTEMKMYVDGQPLLAIGRNGNHELKNGTCAPTDCGSVGVGGTTVTFDTPLPASVGAGHVLTFDARVGGNVENFLILSKPTATTVTVSPAAALNHLMATGSYRITSPFKSGNISPSMAEQAVWIGHGDQPQNVGWSAEWEGDLDEVRVSNVARSASWIQTQYNNQNNPATFYAVGGPVGVALPLPTFTTVYRSIGTNAGVIYSTGTATLALNGTVVSFGGGASLPANVGPGDQLDFTGGPAETLLILSRDSATQMTVQTPAASAHAGQTYTIRRAYNSLSAWETALPPNLVSANVREVGVAYNDGPFTGSLTFSGSVTDPVHNIVLTANTPARTRGTPGSGVVLDNGANASAAINVWDQDVTIERFEITGGGPFGAPGIDIRDTGANHVVVSNCLIHDIQEDGIRLANANSVVDIHSNFIFNTEAGIRITKDLSASSRVNIANNTLYNNLTAGITSRDERDFGGTPVRQTSARVTLRNNIAHSNGVDFEIAKPFDEAYFCTGITGVDPTGCASVTAALADPASNSALGFTAADRCLYLGASDRFRGVAVTPLTPPSGTGANLQWDYWNGAAWASLEGGSFRDYNFQWPGYAYAPDDPTGWTTRTVGAAVAARYYVRACYAGSASSPTEKLIVRADVTVASRYNLAKDKTGLYNSLWRGVGQTGIESPSGPIGAGVSFVSATDLHIQSASAARDAVVNQSRADGNQVGGIQNPRFTRDFDLQLRPLFTCPGDCWDIGADEYVLTTAVRLMSFDAVAEDAAVALTWQTASELDNLGFHLYRGPSADGPWTRLDDTLIPGLGSSATGKAYSYRDAGLQNGTRYFYRLEDVDASSKLTSHGPVSAVPSAGGADGAPGPQPSTGSGARAKNKGSAPPSCPAWVVSAYASSTGAGGATALVCTRHGDPDAVSLGVVARDSRSATLELRTGGFYSLREASGGVRVFVPGFEFASDPQAAALPFRRALVDAVVGRRVALGGVRATDQVAFPGLVPSALGKAEMQVAWDGTVRAARRGVRAPALQGSSNDLARLLPSVFQGETKSAVIEISPLRFDARRQQLLLAKRVRVRLLFSGRETAESGRGSVGRRGRGGKPASDALLARLYTTSRGLYAVSFDQLFPGRRRGLLASELRLERLGEAQPFHLEPAADAFGPGGVLYFHADADAASTDFSSETAFELVLSNQGLTMPLASAAPSGGAVASASFGLARFETNRFYQPGLLDAPDPWLWENLASGTTRTKSFTLTGVSASAAQAAELEVFLQGASESGGAVDHHVSVSLNGTLAGEARFAGKKPYRMTLGVPAALLREGANELSLTNVADTGAASYVFLDRFTLCYPQVSSLAGGRFEGTWSDAGTVTLGGLTAPVALLDVTATGPPGARWLTDYEVSGGSLRFRAEAGHRYLAVSQASLLTPRVAAPAPSSLRTTTNQADYLLIAPRAFVAAAEPLLQRRRDQGLSARAVAFEEIAEQFGHGQPSAEAIRSFVAYAFQSWTRPSPRYVLLLGDASYDPRNFMGTSPPAPLPALWTRTSYLWTASDPLLAAVNGDDALPDLAIGRLPAATVEEAERLIAKLLAWEDSGQGLSGAAALVADNPDLAGDFEADVRDIAASFLSQRNPRLLLLRELGAGARPAIQETLDSGLGLLSYVGHGGAAVWASENVWNSWDAASLQAQSRQPLLLTLNCLNGYFVAPAFDSLTESLLKAEGRGAIAGFSPSGLSLDGPAHQYHRALMAELTSGRHERLGDALTAAQKAYAETGLMPELISVYHLLGDPATQIR